MGKARAWDALWGEIEQAGLIEDKHVRWAVESLQEWERRLTCEQIEAIAELVFAVRHGIVSRAGHGLDNLPPRGTWRRPEDAVSEAPHAPPDADTPRGS